MLLRCLAIPTNGLDLVRSELDVTEEGHATIKLFHRRTSELGKDVDGEGGSTLHHHLELLWTRQKDEAPGYDDANLFSVNLVHFLTEFVIGGEKVVDDGGGDVFQIILMDARKSLRLDILPCLRLDQLDTTTQGRNTVSCAKASEVGIPASGINLAQASWWQQRDAQSGTAGI